ncbi:toll/interleukin-1 receptor domain-containing protein, partial [Frankia canadensis]|uniref:toll/interleukin-1 receptor domain-containing protein n=1 Tax=Frankia canadensis TaxID=1836972 RepID=UPI0010546BE8
MRSGGDPPSGLTDSAPAPGDRQDFGLLYSRRDIAWARWIAWVLEERVLLDSRPATVFHPEWDIVPGSNQPASMARMLEFSDRVVLILSPDFVADSQNDSIASSAILHERRIVPVRVAECQPGPLLQPIVQIDLTGQDETAALTSLLAGIDAAVEGRAKPPTAPPFPSVAGPGGEGGPGKAGGVRA